MQITASQLPSYQRTRLKLLPFHGKHRLRVPETLKAFSPGQVAILIWVWLTFKLQQMNIPVASLASSSLPTEQEVDVPQVEPYIDSLIWMQCLCFCCLFEVTQIYHKLNLTLIA